MTFVRWVSGLRGGRNGFDSLSATEQNVLLANYRSVLRELDPHPIRCVAGPHSDKEVGYDPGADHLVAGRGDSERGAP